MKKRLVQLQVSFIKEGNRYVAFSPALDFATSGKTLKEAQKMFEEGVAIFLDELERDGATEEVLTNLGWEKHGRKYNPPMIVGQSLQPIMMPA